MGHFKTVGVRKEREWRTKALELRMNNRTQKKKWTSTSLGEVRGKGGE